MTQWRRHGTGARRPGLGKSQPHRLLGHLPLAILIRTSSSLQPSRPHHVCPWTPQCPRVRTWTRSLPLPWASPSRLPRTSSWIATHEEPSMGTGCPPQPSSSLSHSPPIFKASGLPLRPSPTPLGLPDQGSTRVPLPPESDLRVASRRLMTRGLAQLGDEAHALPVFSALCLGPLLLQFPTETSLRLYTPALLSIPQSFPHVASLMISRAP